MLNLRVPLICLGLLFSACGDGKGPFSSDDAPNIQVGLTNGQLVSIDSEVGLVNGAGEFEITNEGAADLEIFNIAIVSEPTGSFQLFMDREPNDDNPIVLQKSLDAYRLSVQLSEFADPSNSRSTITITTNNRVDGKTKFSFDIEVIEGSSSVTITPNPIDFDRLNLAEDRTISASIINTGSAELVIRGLRLTGHPGFQVQLGGQAWTANADTAVDTLFTTPVTVAAGATQSLPVQYRADTLAPARATLTLLTNDANELQKEVSLLANTSGPCIQFVPDVVDFGGRLLNQQAALQVALRSCGTEDLVLSSVVVSENAGGVFSVNPTTLPAAGTVLAPGEQHTITVYYQPTEEAELVDGMYTRDSGILHASSNAFLAEYDVELTGFGTARACPNVQIEVEPALEVAPQTNLQLHGIANSPTGEITTYEWSVVQPVGSVSSFLPNQTVADPTFEVNQIGPYHFKLKVYDSAGNVSCEDAEVTVQVLTTNPIHVELTWDTPGDFDQTDTGTFPGNPNLSVGSDVDLHFISPNAVGYDLDDDGFSDGWFDDVYDVWWRNSHPDWGVPLDVSDNPGLDRDDTDGAGPENLNYDAPQAGRYKVGAHYWNDHGYGISYATLKVWIFGTLREEWEGVQLINLDMWEALTIDWPGTTIARIYSTNNQPLIRKNFDGTCAATVPPSCEPQ